MNDQEINITNTEDEERVQKYQMRADLARAVISTGFTIFGTLRPDKVHKIALAFNAINTVLKAIEDISVSAVKIDQDYEQYRK